MHTLIIAVSVTPGGAGWAWRRTGPSGHAEGDAGEAGTTGPRAELRAVIDALASVPGPVRIEVPSAQLVTLATRWMPTWKASGWRKADGKPVANVDLVRALDAHLAARDAEWVLAVDSVVHKALRARAKARRDALPAVAPGAAPAAPGAVAHGAAVPGTAARVLAYTDGGCRGNPGIGGWGAILVDPTGAKARVLVGGEPDTTNNRMEMTAALKVLESLTVAGVHVEIRTDSRYLVDVGSKWLAGWKRGGWRRKDGEPVKNLDLVQALDVQIARHKVRWTWVEGHAGEPGNELVDRLTNDAMDAIRARRDPGRDEVLVPSPLRLLNV